MRPLRAWLVYLGLVLAGGALLAPCVYGLAQAGAAHFPGLERLAQHPFHRFVNRCVLGLALVGLWPLLRYLGVRSWGEVGLAWTAGQGRRILGGLGLGLGSLAIVALAAILGGARSLNLDYPVGEVAKHWAGAGLTAVVVSLLEEMLFRGALFGSLRRVHHWVSALAFSSLVYAWVHFFAPVRWPGSVEWATGFAVLAKMLHGFVELRVLVPGFFNLALAGVLLGLAYQRTGSLYFSIGLHAGWIFWLKSYGFLTRPAPGGDPWFWGSEKLIDGWAALIVLGLTLGVLAKWFSATEPKEARRQ